MLTVNPTGALPAILPLGLSHVVKSEPSGTNVLSCDFNPFSACLASPVSCNAVSAVEGLTFTLGSL